MSRTLKMDVCHFKFARMFGIMVWSQVTFVITQLHHLHASSDDPVTIRPLNAETSSVGLTIQIEDVPDLPPKFDSSNYEFKIYENQPYRPIMSNPFGKVNAVEDKLKITKLAWETAGVRSVKNDIKIKEEFNFKQSAKDLLITSQLRSALIFNKKIKATNYQIDTYKKKIFIYGIAHTAEERKEAISEAKEILDVIDVIASIFLVEDLRIQKN